LDELANLNGITDASTTRKQRHAKFSHTLAQSIESAVLPESIKC